MTIERENQVLKAECNRLIEALSFYANHNHWMSNTESGDCNLLIAHGRAFDNSSNGWVEAESAIALCALAGD